MQGAGAWRWGLGFTWFSCLLLPTSSHPTSFSLAELLECSAGPGLSRASPPCSRCTTGHTVWGLSESESRGDRELPEGPC